MNPFLYYSLASIVTAFFWTLLMMSADQRNRRWLGLAGAWAAALVSLSLWQVDNLPWLLDFIRPVVWIWLGAIVLLMMAAATTWGERQARQWPLVCGAVMSTVVNVVAVLHFLWIATVSAGGV